MTVILQYLPWLRIWLKFLFKKQVGMHCFNIFFNTLFSSLKLRKLGTCIPPHEQISYPLCSVNWSENYTSYLPVIKLERFWCFIRFFYIITQKPLIAQISKIVSVWLELLIITHGWLFWTFYKSQFTKMHIILIFFLQIFMSFQTCCQKTLLLGSVGPGRVGPRFLQWSNVNLCSWIYYKPPDRYASD